MPIKVTMRTTVPAGVIPSREKPEFAEAFVQRHNIVSKRATDIQLTKSQDDQGHTTELVVETTYADMAALDAQIAEIAQVQSSELAAIKEYSADNGIVTHRKIVDADTGTVIEDWKVV